MALQNSVGVTAPTPNNGGTSGGGGLLDSALNIIDPAGIRKQVSGLLSGGVTSLFNKSAAPGVNVVNANDPTNPLGNDWRVRISWPPAVLQRLGNPLFAPLGQTNGVIFPYTPSITVTHNARYTEQALTHSNYKNYFYEGSDVAAITITGDFTVQNTAEGLYLLAAIYFFRSSTKMFFGNEDSAGNPPPMVFLDGYGDFYFPHVPCVVTSFQHTMPQDCDYLEIHYTGGALGTAGSQSNTSLQTARLPTTSQITLTIQPVYSRQNIHNNMTLSKFASGALLSGNGGFL
jgi:hypothetical protein